MFGPKHELDRIGRKQLWVEHGCYNSDDFSYDGYLLSDRIERVMFRYDYRYRH